MVVGRRNESLLKHSVDWEQQEKREFEKQASLVSTLLPHRERDFD